MSAIIFRIPSDWPRLAWLAAALLAASCSTEDAQLRKSARPASPATTEQTAEVHFVDAFSRKPEDPEPWRVVRGAWQLENVTNRMAYNHIPVTNKYWIRRWGQLRDEGPKTWFLRCANPMRYFGKADDWGLTVTGQPTWGGYRFEASARSLNKAIGVAFGYRAANDFFLLHWNLKTLYDQPARLRLVRFTPEGSQPLAAADVMGSVGQWYRFRVDLDGRRLSVYIDDCRVLDLMLDEPVRGGVGLYVEGRRGASFDDVSVNTLKRHRLDRPEVLTERTDWQVSPQAKLSPGKGPFPFGARGYDRVLTFKAALPADAWRFDVALGQGEDGAHYAVSLESGPKPTASLVCSTTDARQSLASVDASFTPKGEREFVADLSAPGMVKLYVDDVLQLRAKLPQALTVGFGLERATANLLFQPQEIADTRAEHLEQFVSSVPLFETDPFMLQWSSPQGYWMPQEQPNTFWHKSDFFGRYDISVPMRDQWTVAFGADARDFDRGYRLDVHPAEPAELLAFTGRKPSGYVVELRSVGRLLARANFAPPPEPEPIEPAEGEQATPPEPARLALHKDGHYIWFTVGDKEALAFRDPHPLPGRLVGMRSADALDPNKIRVTRNHVIDDYFNHAPTSWRSSGWWDVHNRFDCYPHWWHFMTGIKGVSTLWNKRRFEGDFTLEFYAGMRMRPWLHWSWYPRLGDVNAVVCGDGKDITTGYNSIIGAWDPYWSGTWSRLLRGTTTVAQTDAHLIPSRETKYQRPIKVPYIRHGRPYHGAWYYIRIRRIGAMIEVSCEDTLAMTFDDPRPLDGESLGLWVQDNFFIMSRAQVNYTKTSVANIVAKPHASPELSGTLLAAAKLIERDPESLAPQPPPPLDQRYDKKTVWGNEYGGLRADVSPIDLPHSRAITVTSSTHPGLWFDFERGLQGWHPEVDVTDVELHITPGMPTSGNCLELVNVGRGGLFGARVHTPRLELRDADELSFDYRLDSSSVKVNFYLLVSGQWFFVHLTGPNASHSLMRRLTEVEPVVGRWATVKIDLGKRLAQIDPFRRSWTLEQLFVGDLHEGYLRAGFGGNPDRARYAIDNVKVVTRGGCDFAANVASKGRLDLSCVVDRSPDTVPDNSPDAAATITRAALAPGRWYLHVRPTAGQRGTTHLAFDVAAQPLRIAQLSPADGSKWGGGPVVVEFEPKDARGPRLAGASIAVNGRRVSLSPALCRYDAFQNRLTLNAQAIAPEVEHGEGLNLELAFPTGEPQAISHWRVIGPFDNSNDSAFEREDAPEREIDFSQTYAGKRGVLARWQELRDTEVVDARKLFPTDWAAVYAAAFIDLPADRAGAQLLAGFDDWAKVWVNGQLVFGAKRHGGYNLDEFAFTADLHKGRNTVLVKVGNGDGDWKFGLRVARPQQRFAWRYVADRTLDAWPPSLVEVEGRVADLDFEDGLGTWSGNGALISLDDSTAAAGRYSVKMSNPRLQGRFGAYAFRAPFSVGRFPVVAFDYRLPRYTRTDFVVDTTCYGPRNVVLADDDNNLGRLGEFADVARDDTWHHAEINLAKLVARRPFHRRMFDASGMCFGDWGYGANGPTGVYHIDNFTAVETVSSREGLRLVWRAHDLFGIRGYSFHWSDKADDSPDERIDSVEPEATFKGLPEGERWFHVRACDASGNWGAPRHFRYIIDNTPPAAKPLEPAPNAGIGSGDFELLLSDAGSGIDPASLFIHAAGQKVAVDAPTARLDADGKLEWNWCLGTKFGSGKVSDRAAVTFSVEPVADNAGNKAEGQSWTCTIDYAEDSTPPPAPEMVVAEPYLCFNAFATEFGDFKSYGGRGAIVEQAFDKERGDYCVELTNELSGSEFGASMWLKAYDAKQYPFVAFDYKLPKGIRLMIMAYVKGQWRVVRLTDRGWRKPNIGSAPNIVADGKWHSTCIDLGGMLQSHLRGEDTLVVDKLVIGTWSRAKNGPGVKYRLDNFAIFGRGTGAFEPTWVSYDPTGIAAFSYAVDRKPDTTPPADANEFDPQAYTLADGPWYVHVRAQDGAGHWGAASHAPYYGPAPPRPEPEPRLEDEFLPEDTEFGGEHARAPGEFGPVRAAAQ